MGKKSKATIGYRYYMGIHMALARGPLDEIVEIRVGDKQAWKGSITGNTEIYIDQPNLFGGEEKEGGIQGTLAVLMGAKTQTVHARLAAMLGGIVPAFRGVATTFFDGLICAMSPYPKTWAWRVRRTQKGWHSDAVWYPAKATISLEGGAIQAMNPAHILYQAYTDPRMGRGLPASRLDDAAWQAAADVFFAEGFGMCIKWSRQDGIDKFAQAILDHVGAAVYTSRRTGLIVLMPTRDNYNVAALPNFTYDTGLLSIEDDETASQMGGTNEVIVKYRDPVAKQDKQVRAKNLGAIHAAGGVTSSTTLDMFGIPTAALANRVAQRELRVSSGFIRRFKLKLDRRGADIMPGSVFTISDSGRGITNMVLRAGSCDYGTMTDGSVTITAVLDVFGLPATAITTPEPPGYVPPSTQPAPVTLRRPFEAPYRELVQALGSAEAQAKDPAAAYLMTAAVAPTSLSLGYEVLNRVGTAAFAVTTLDGPFCPSGALSVGIDQGATQITVLGAVRLDEVRVGTAALIDNEIVRVDAVNPQTGVCTIGRGCADTVPAAHAAGARIWFYDDFAAIPQVEYSQGVTVDTKLLTRTTTGILAESAAPIDSLAFVGRARLPYPPAKLRINNAAWPASAEGALTVSWVHRNRLTQADQLIDNEAGSVTPEANTTYTVRVLRADTLAQLTLTTGIAGTSATINPGYDGLITVQVWSVRDGLASSQLQAWTLDYLRGALRITQDGETRITESGAIRITE